MITCQHTCGKYDVVIDDYVKIGIDAVLPARTSNDPVMFQKKYGERPTVVAGVDSPEPVGQESASEEMLRAEGQGMAHAYAVNGAASDHFKSENLRQSGETVW